MGTFLFGGQFVGTKLLGTFLSGGDIFGGQIVGSLFLGMLFWGPFFGDHMSGHDIVLLHGKSKTKLFSTLFYYAEAVKMAMPFCKFLEKVWDGFPGIIERFF